MKDDRIMILQATSPLSKMCLKRMKDAFEGAENVCTIISRRRESYTNFVFKSESFGFNLTFGMFLRHL